MGDQHRHYLMGQCIDLNLLTWLMNSCEAQPDRTHASIERPPRTPPQISAPEQRGPGSARPRTPLVPLDRAATLPMWKQAHDPRSFIYTDGSKTTGAPVLGTAVFHAPTGKMTHIDSTGCAECNTVVRAELAGIFHALQEHSQDNHIHILTDSLTAIQKIQLLHSQPLQSTRDHHQHVLKMIAKIIEKRAQAGLTTKINKVSAHTGVWGNEEADKAAKSVVTALIKHATGEGVPYPEWIKPTDVPMQPHRPPHPLTDDPPPKPDGTQQSPKLFTTKQNLHRYIKPKLRLHTAPASTYYTLMSQAKNHEDQTDFTNTARHIKALIATGARHQAKRLLAFVWGTMYTQKQAFRFGYSKDQICPVCTIDTDSCTHVGSGCRHPHLKSLYIDRHSAAVRLIRNFIANSPVGASLTLICEDSGRKPLPEDLLHDDNILEKQEEFLRNLPQTTYVQPPPGHCPMNHRTQDVTLDLKDHNQAADREASPGSQPSHELRHEQTTEHSSIHQTIPDWVLPKDAQNRLLQAEAGFKPDLLFIQGAPSPKPATVTDTNRAQWKLTVLEVGFCADLRLKSKQAEKVNKYEPLMTELRKRWTHVHFIAIPIGNTGAMLSSTKQELGRLVSTQPRKKVEQQRSEQLARILATMAARRLYGVTAEYYRLRKVNTQQQQQSRNGSDPSKMLQNTTSYRTPTHSRLPKRPRPTYAEAPPVPVPAASAEPAKLMRASKEGTHLHPHMQRGTAPQHNPPADARARNIARRNRARRRPTETTPPSRATILPGQPCQQRGPRDLDVKPG